MPTEISIYELKALSGALLSREIAKELADLVFLRNYQFSRDEIKDDAMLIIDMWANLGSEFFSLDIVSYKHQSKLSEASKRIVVENFGADAFFTIAALSNHADKLKLKEKVDNFLTEHKAVEPQKEDYLELGIELSSLNVMEDETNFKEDITNYIQSCEDIMSNKRSVLKTGINSLDELINGVIDDDIVVVGGYSGSGKTHMLVQMSNAAIKQGKKICFISNEMRKQDIAVRFVCSEAGIGEKSTYSSTHNLRHFKKVADDMFDLHSEFLNIQYIDEFEKAMAYLGYMASLKRIDVVYIDYLQQFYSSKKFNSERERLVYYCDQIKAFARKYSVPLFLAAQIGKSESRGADDNANLVSFSGSAAIRNIASIAMVLKRSGERNVRTEDAEMILVKGRRGEHGSVEGYYEYPDPKFKCKTDDNPY